MKERQITSLLGFKAWQAFVLLNQRQLPLALVAELYDTKEMLL